MHRACRQDHWHRDFFCALEPVSQHDMRSTRTHCILGLLANSLQPITQAIFIRTRSKGRVNRHHGIAKMLYHRVKLRIAHERTVENQNLCLAAIFVQHILQVAEARLKAHHPIFAQTVNRGVRHLTEILAEEVAQWAIFLRQNRAWRIIAHGGQGLFAIFGHWCKDMFQFLNRIARGHLTAAQIFT